jgi:hypothetical protein
MTRHAGTNPFEFDAGVPTDWDPLVDPWPASSAVSQATPLERTVRDEVDPLGLSYSTRAWTLISEAADLVSSANEVAELEVRVAQPTPAPEVVIPPRDPRREAQAAIETQPVDLADLADLGEHPSGPLPRAGSWPPVGGVPESPAELERIERAERAVEKSEPVESAPRFDVTLMGPLGDPEFGFSGGQWYSLTGDSAREVTVGDAIVAHPDKAGPIVQLACWYLREKPSTGRALDLATELAMAVSDLARRELFRERRSA